jgi:hypothetical protein
MFDIGSVELLVLLLMPISGLFAAGYLALSLRNNSRGGQTRH